MANLNLNFPDISKVESALLKAYKSTMAFAKMFLPDFDYSIKPFRNPPAHYEVMKVIDSPRNNPVALICCRDFGKSTLCKALILRRLCFAKRAEDWGIGPRASEYIGWVSSSQRKSQNHTSYVKKMIEFNTKIISIFGHLKGTKWSTEEISTIYDDKLVSSSNLSSLRGDAMTSVETGAERFSMVLADDSENENNTITLNARERFASIISNSIMPAIEVRKPGNKFVFINTPVHYAGFTQDKIELYKKIEDPDERRRITGWEILFYPARYPDGTLVWPDRLNEEFLQQRMLEAANSPRGVSSFYQEYMLEVQSEEDAVLGRKYIKYHDAEFLWHDNQTLIKIDNIVKPVNIFIGCDPATDIKTRHADYSVIIVVAIDRENNVYVLHYERHRGIPTSGQRGPNDELIGEKGVVDYIIDLHLSYHAKRSSVEDVAMTRSVMQALNYRRDIMNRWDIVVLPYKPTTKENKLNRIYTMLGQRFQNGKIYIRKTHYELENEIVTFGERMAHDDIIDALHIAMYMAYPYSGKDVVTSKNKYRRQTKAKSWQGA